MDEFLWLCKKWKALSDQYPESWRPSPAKKGEKVPASESACLSHSASQQMYMMQAHLSRYIAHIHWRDTVHCSTSSLTVETHIVHADSMQKRKTLQKRKGTEEHEVEAILEMRLKVDDEIIGKRGELSASHV